MKKTFTLLSALMLLCACGGGVTTKTTPVLSSNIDKMEDVTQGTTVTIPEVTAHDKHDGDLTDKILTIVRNPSKTVITPTNKQFVCENVGKYSISFSVENSFGNSASLVYEFQSIDALSPVITLATDPLADGYLGEEYVLPVVTATDPTDGDISSSVTCVVKDPSENVVALEDNSFVPAATGQYAVTYSVTNSLNKTTNLSRNFTILPAVIPVITGDVAKIPTMYVSQTLTLPTITVTDARDPSITVDDVVLEITYPDKTKATYTDSTLAINQIGEYILSYSVTDSFSKTGRLEYRFEAKEQFVIGWSNQMYTAAISGLTGTIMSAYKDYIDANVEFGDVPVKLQGFDNDNYPNLAEEIINAKCDILVGFTKALYVEASGTTAGGNLQCIDKQVEEIAFITNRYISQQNDSALSKQVYELSLTETALATLTVKKIVIAWFDNAGSTAERMSNVDTQVKTYLTELGYNIDVTSQKFTRGSKSYDEVHNEIVAAEAVFGLNWGSNFNLSNGFKFLNARMGSGFKFGNQSSRYVTGMIKDGGDYSFYSDLFAYLKSDEMKAIYIA